MPSFFYLKEASLATAGAILAATIGRLLYNGAPVLKIAGITAGVALSAVTLPVVYIGLLQYSRIRDMPKDVPWVGVDETQWFAKIRANLRDFTKGRETLLDGYNKYSKHDKPFILPGLHWPEIVLPPKDTAWFISHPENEVSDNTVQEELLGLDYFGHGPDAAAVHDFTVIRRDLTRKMGQVLPEMLDEVEVSFDNAFKLPEHGGSDTGDWQHIVIMKVIQKSVLQTMNRVFLGLPLCRDRAWHKAFFYWMMTFALMGIFFRYTVPGFAKPVIGPIFAVPVEIMRYFAVRKFMPELRRRLADLRTTQNDPRHEVKVERKNDFMQWIIENAAEKQDPAMLKPWDLAGKVILLNFFAVHTTSVTAGTVLFDLISHPDASNVLAALREEADNVLPQALDDPRALRNMVKMDSAIRETMRYNPMFDHGNMREIVKPGGVTTPDGLYLKQGSHIGSVVSFMQRDPDFVKDGDKYEPLRHYNQVVNGQSDKQLSAVQISDKYLTFGLGKHACPGRFFALQSLKLILGHLVTHYDFEPLKERPKFLEISGSCLPPEKEKIKVRRRPRTAAPEAKPETVTTAHEVEDSQVNADDDVALPQRFASGFAFAGL